MITSQTGAAVKDIIQVARRRNPSIPLTIYPTHVQGECAVPEIVEALKIANKEKRVDVIILGRGGGSIEDLWAFNEEAVARAIAESEIPIVSAVGHEVDFTIADFVSDQRAATPSAAAELVIPSQKELMETLLKYERSLKLQMEAKTSRARHQLESILSRPIFARKDIFYKRKMQEVDELSQKLYYQYSLMLQAHQKRYEIAVENLERLSPIHTLKRGYSLVSQDKEIIKSITQVKVDDMIEVTVTDGSFKAKVSEKE